MNKMFLSASFIIAISLVSKASSDYQDPDWIDNSDSAPLILIAKGRSLTVQNRADKTVQSYQLGCVRKGRRSAVVHRFALQKFTILPSTGVLSGSFDAPLDEQIECQKRKAKLSVLETTFQDGTTWHLPDVAQSSPIAQDPDWIGNIKDAPLLITSQGKAVILKNRTDKLIESFRLGCVLNKTDHLTVAHRFRLEHAPIPALGDATYTAFDGPPKEQVACQNLRAKLSVLQVNFKDGATWQPPGNSSQHSKSKIDNTRGAPLVIVGKQHTLTVQNRSEKTVQSYRLGCVRKNRSSIVVHRFPLEKATIAPSTGAMNATFDAPPEEQVTCQRLRARVSVLEATFNDGTKWHLPNDSSQSSHNLAKKKSQAALK